MSSVLLGEPQSHERPDAAAPPAPRLPPPAALADGGAQRGSALTVIAGVGVLLLAMGVGVLIGRSGSSAPSAAAAPQVISVASAPPAGTATAPAGEASFTGDWPAGTSGYTVALQTLPRSGTTLAAVESAKSAASAKGAKAVGALKSEEFASLPAGGYVIYSGVFHKRSEAEQARGALKRSFPGAKVLTVSKGGAGSRSPAQPSSTPGKGVGESESHPAPPSVLNKLKGTRGKSYEQQSKSLPNVLETGTG